MKLLRHPPLLFWITVVVVLAALLTVSWRLGATSDAPAERATLVAGSDRMQSTTVLNLRNRMPSLLVLARDPSPELIDWANQTAEQADDAAAARVVAAGETDPLAVAYATLAADSRRLAAATSDYLDVLDDEPDSGPPSSAQSGPLPRVDLRGGDPAHQARVDDARTVVDDAVVVVLDDADRLLAASLPAFTTTEPTDPDTTPSTTPSTQEDA